MRELDEVVQSRNRTHKAAHEARLMPAALQTSELVNVVGTLGAGNKWKPVRPAQYFEAWTGSKAGPAITSESLQRIERELEAGIMAREAKVIARRAVQSSETQKGSDAQG